MIPLTCQVSNSTGKHLPRQNESRLQDAGLLTVSHVNELPAAWLTGAQNGKKKKSQFEGKGKATLSDEVYGPKPGTLPGIWDESTSA